jgi:hypothetical protein
VVSWNGGKEAPFRMDVMLPGEIRTAPAVAANASALAPAPTAAAAMLPSGALAYADLKGREGAHIEIRTSNGTLRRGTLVAYSPFLSTIRLDSDQGGFNMSIPGDSVEEVRAIPAQTMQAAAPAADAGAAAAPGAPRS